MDPPPCVQNAMMTKDKKPFTYTPGGIDLSEVRSPRMQRRIERNANLGGVSDVAQQPQRPQTTGPLPPAALAAMRPQPQVQVFPGPPPPPPMSKSIPPPPPPPACPLPTQKVTTGDNQVVERPDMTKIIPDNPMALLRKTGGPAIKKSFVEQMYEEQQKNPPSAPQRLPEVQSPRIPPVIERSTPVSPPAQQHRQPQQYQPQPQLYHPQPQQHQAQPQQYQPQPQPHQFQPPTPPQNQYQQPAYQPVQSPQPQNQQRSAAPNYQPPIIERQSSLGKQDQPQKTVSSSLGSLYIPPINQQQQTPQQRFSSPPSPPEREYQTQSPGTPTLKEAPRPWQQKNLQQQQTVPPWAKRDDEIDASCQSPPAAPSMRWQQPAKAPASPSQAAPQQTRPPTNQQFSPRSPAAQQPPQNQSYSSNSFPVHIEIRAVPYPPEPEPSDKKPEAVYVTQPIVLQHPGPRVAPPYQGQLKSQQQQTNQNYNQQTRQQTVQQHSKVDSSGTRIIPIQIERTPPSTPGAERNLNRQHSWGTQPTQSNSFKVIQKFTKTDENEDDDTPLTQHSARFTQEMPEQVRKMKISDNEHFKQDVQIYDEENPRYRGGYIPSRIFKLLDESVPQEFFKDIDRESRITREPKGNGQSQPYVHPSEQVVPEPKKYMGGNIPSRSFKILQAMTAPSDGCANANYNEELPYNPMFHPYNNPYYPSPYWPDYSPYYYPPEQSEHAKSSEKSSTKSGRSTPLLHAPQCAPPSWNEYYSPFYPQQQSDSSSKMSDKSSTRSGRSTPLTSGPPGVSPYWHDHYNQFYPQQQSDSSSRMSDKSNSTKSGRSTPLPSVTPLPPPMPPPYWGYMPPPRMPPNVFPKPQSTPTKTDNLLRPRTPKSSEYQSNSAEVGFQYPPYHMYPPFYDPYYYSYYYGYPPMMPPYPYYAASTENEELSGYSSQDEMSSYNNRRSSLKRRNSLENSSNTVQALTQHFEVRSKSATPRITITPSFSQDKSIVDSFIDRNEESGDESETEVEDEPEKSRGLRSIRSVQNINVFASEGSDSDTSESEESSEEETEEEESEIAAVQNGEEIIPHQLSVIYEESERGDSRRSFRPSSVASETTTIAEQHSEEDDDEDFLASQNVRYKINMFQETNEQLSVRSIGNKTVSAFEQETQSFASLKLRNEHSMKTCQFEYGSENVGGEIREQEKSIENKTMSAFEQATQSFASSKLRNEQCVSENVGGEISEREKSCGRNLSIENISVENQTLVAVGSKKDDIHVGININQDVEDADTNNETDADWWVVIKNDESNTESDNESNNIRSIDNKCDNVKLKAEYVMMYEDEQEVVSTKDSNSNDVTQDYRESATNTASDSADNEVVYVKLKNKSNVKEEMCSFENQTEGKVTNNLFFNTMSTNRSSVYDILKENDTEEEIVSGGTLMNVGSFVSALETIKRNSGLWHFEEINFGNPPTIKEETQDNEYSKTVEFSDYDNSKVNEIESNDSKPDEYIECFEAEKETANESEESEVDFWSQIKGDDDDFQPRRQSYYFKEEEHYTGDNNQTDIVDTLQTTEEKQTDSASSRHSSFSESQAINKSAEVTNTYNETPQEIYHTMHQSFSPDNDKSSEETSSESEEEHDNQVFYVEEERKRNSHSRSRSLEPQTIKERIEALKNSIVQKQMILVDKEEITVSVKSKISAIEVPQDNRSKTTSTKSSVKSFEEYSEEEEGDSGVISDVSRHISDNEEFPELRKLTRYERAATHSRLFKLLQDEYDIEGEEGDDEVFAKQEDKFSRLSVRRNKSRNKLAPSRSKLSLALEKFNEDSNEPPVNEKLVDELVQSLLRSRKAQVFKNMPKEKLRTAAKIILREGIEGCETPTEEFSSLLSPLRGDTESSTPAQTPQEFYADNSLGPDQSDL